ncbi:MAG: polysaccharide biosynthesis C-terminal domain-containing protein, partial [Clostridiales bacterium]|nr:polysaccharide biosynthesis C-terminal domain-containing protein [Clostridiales bacterium]
KFGLGIKGYLLSMVMAYWATIVVLVVGSKAWKDIISPTKIEKSYVKKMLTYSIPLMPNSISWWISNSSDRYIMKMFRGLAELGVYSISYKIPSIMATVSSIMISAWEMSAVDDFGSEKSRKFFSQIYELWINVYIIVCTILIIFVKLLAYILFQKEFFEAWHLVPILLFASIFNGLSSFLGTVFTAAKETRSVFVTTMAGAIVNIILNFLMIPFWGGYGAAIATAIGYLVTFFARLVGSNKIMKFDVNHKEHILKLGFVMIVVILSCMNSWLNYVVGAGVLFFERKFIMGMINKGTSRIKRK